MDNFNLQLATIETNLNKILNKIPAGIAYFILKSKVKEFEDIYYNQVEKEYAAVAQQQPMNQTKEEQIQTEIQNEPTTA